MDTCAQFRLFAKYNQWMNQKLYDCAATLSANELARPRGAFFGSILGTLNHIVVADTLWLQRFARYAPHTGVLQPVLSLETPPALDSLVFNDMDALTRHRHWLDNIINEWAASLTQVDMQARLRYTNSKGVSSEKAYAGLILHLFNHQTHHRGQVTTLLSQAGLDVGSTDLLGLIDDVITP